MEPLVPSARDYTIPSGCPVCGADLTVRVTASGPLGICRQCKVSLKPQLRVTAHGLEVEFQSAAA